MEHFALYPVDTIKVDRLAAPRNWLTGAAQTYLQANPSTSHHETRRMVKELIRERGFGGLWRGCRCVKFRATGD